MVQGRVFDERIVKPRGHFIFLHKEVLLLLLLLLVVMMFVDMLRLGRPDLHVGGHYGVVFGRRRRFPNRPLILALYYDLSVLP